MSAPATALCRNLSESPINPLKVGESIPNVNLSLVQKLDLANPSFSHDNMKVIVTNTLDSFSKDIALFFITPKPFNKICTQFHLSGYVDYAGILHELGVKTIACVALASPDTVWRWKATTDRSLKIMMMADPVGAFCQQLGILNDQTKQGYGIVPARGLFIFDKGKLVYQAIESETVCDSTSISAAIDRIQEIAQKMSK